MIPKHRHTTLTAAIVFGLYMSVVLGGLAAEQRQLMSLIREVRGHVELRSFSIWHCLPGDRVRAVRLPESVIAERPDLMTKFRYFRRLDRVAIEVITAQCPDKARVISAPSPAAAWQRYYRFTLSGRPCSMTESAID